MQSTRDMSLGVRPRGMSRFDSSFQDFLYDNGFHYYTTQFYQELNIQSIQDLALLSDDELRQVLPPTEMTNFRNALSKYGVKRIPPEQLIGRWIDVEGFGPGKVVHYHKVSNRLLFDSKHSIDFRGPEFKVLLRRRKFMRWNGGARYIVLNGEPTTSESIKAVENEHEVLQDGNIDSQSGGEHSAQVSNSQTVQGDVDESWEACIDPNTGDTYYYNLVTLETSWTLPDKRQLSNPTGSNPASPSSTGLPDMNSFSSAGSILPLSQGGGLLPPSSDETSQAEHASQASHSSSRPNSVRLLARPPSLRAMPRVPSQPKEQTSSSSSSPASMSSVVASTTPADNVHMTSNPAMDGDVQQLKKKRAEESTPEEKAKAAEHDAAKNRHLDKVNRSYKVINPKTLGLKSPRGRSNSPTRPGGANDSSSQGEGEAVQGSVSGASTGKRISRYGAAYSGGVVEGKTRLALITDLDGTMLPGPRKSGGKVVHPIMSEGATFAPLVQLLEEGGSVFGVTGGTIALQRSRFWDLLPLKARQEGRVLLFCETGMVLYRSKRSMETYYPNSESKTGDGDDASSGECLQYRLDMTAAAFGQCKCGKPKADHTPEALSAKSNNNNSPAKSNSGGGNGSQVSPSGSGVSPGPNERAEDGGEPVEDTNYGPFPGNTQRYLSEEVSDRVIAAARKGMREWFTDLKNDRSLLEEGHWIHDLADRWSEEDAPVTQNNTVTPRIEMRKAPNGKTFGMIIAGVPVQYGDKYLTPKIKEIKEVGGLPTGRLCFDITVPGLGKHLVLDYLLRTNQITAGAVIAMADSPSGNDKGLTFKHNEGIPFVSVYGGSHHNAMQRASRVAHLERGVSIQELIDDDADSSPSTNIMNDELASILVGKVDKSLIPCHVGGNERGSAAVVSRLIPLNRQGLPTLDNTGKESWLDIDRVAEQVVRYAREDLIDM